MTLRPGRDIHSEIDLKLNPTYSAFGVVTTIYGTVAVDLDIIGAYHKHLTKLAKDRSNVLH